MIESNDSIRRPYANEIDLRDVIRAIWAGRWLVVALSAAATILAVIVALILPNVYRAEALLAPNDEDNASSLSALSAQYGGLASLAGIDLGGSSASKAVLGIEVIQSRKFLSEFIERHGILVELIAAEGWDRKTGSLQIDSDLYDTEAQAWVRRVRPPKQKVPSVQEAYREFRDILTISEDSKTGFVTVAVEHYSPEIASQWVEWLVRDVNAELMAKEVAEAQHSIAYLNEQISQTSVAGLQSVFYRLIEEEMKTVLLANVSDEYVFKTIDPAIAPEIKASPNRVLIVLAGLLLGSVLGAVIVLFRASVQTEQN